MREAEVIRRATGRGRPDPPLWAKERRYIEERVKRVGGTVPRSWRREDLYDSARILIDLNVLVYAYDASDLAKQRRAVDVLEALAQTGSGMLSSQVLAEFYATVTRKLTLPLEVEEGG